MKKRDFNKLKLGLYRIYWVDGGSSVAAIGQDHTGKCWIAPTNWTGKSDENGFVPVAVSGRHKMIERVEFITQE